MMDLSASEQTHSSTGLCLSTFVSLKTPQSEIHNIANVSVMLFCLTTIVGPGIIRITSHYLIKLEDIRA